MEGVTLNLQKPGTKVSQNIDRLDLLFYQNISNRFSLQSIIKIDD